MNLTIIQKWLRKAGFMTHGQTHPAVAVHPKLWQSFRNREWVTWIFTVANFYGEPLCPRLLDFCKQINFPTNKYCKSVYTQQCINGFKDIFTKGQWWSSLYVYIRKSRYPWEPVQFSENLKKLEEFWKL